MDPVWIGALGFVVLLIIILLGIPVGISLMVTGLAGLFYLSGGSSTFHLLVTGVFGQATNYEFIAVPMFLLMGYVALEAGLTKPAFESANSGCLPFQADWPWPPVWPQPFWVRAADPEYLPPQPCPELPYRR